MRQSHSLLKLSWFNSKTTIFHKVNSMPGFVYNLLKVSFSGKKVSMLHIPNNQESKTKRSYSKEKKIISFNPFNEH